MADFSISSIAWHWFPVAVNCDNGERTGRPEALVLCRCLHTHNRAVYTTSGYFRQWNYYHSLLLPSTSLSHETGSFRGNVIDWVITHTASNTRPVLCRGKSFHFARPTSWFWLFHLFISYHNKSDIAWDNKDIVWPGINRAPKIAEHEFDHSVSEVREPVCGSHVTTVFYSILQAAFLVMRSSEWHLSHCSFCHVKVCVLGFSMIIIMIWMMFLNLSNIFSLPIISLL